MQCKNIKNGTFVLGDCLEVMKTIPDNYFDMIITSPPYDNLRNYTNDLEWTFESFEKIAKELFRVCKEGASLVWIVNDEKIKGCESLTSFKQCIEFVDIGFNLNDTMIWNKGGFSAVGSLINQYAPVFEFMFVFSKGKPKTTNISLRNRSNKCNDKRTFRRKKWVRNQDGEFTENDYHIREMVPDYNIWDFYVGGGNSTNDKIAFKHPAIFPEELVKRHLESWSNEGELVYDPFMGSGTTSKMCILTNRNYIGSELSSEYCEIEKIRLNNLKSNQTTLDS